MSSSTFLSPAGSTTRPMQDAKFVTETWSTHLFRGNESFAVQYAKRRDEHMRSSETLAVGTNMTTDYHSPRIRRPYLHPVPQPVEHNDRPQLQKAKAIPSTTVSRPFEQE